MSTKKLFPARFPISLGRWFNAVALQNVRDSRARDDMSQVSQGTLKSPVTPTAILFGHSNNEVRNLRGRPGVRNALPSYFLAINFRCHANSVSGVTMVATCAKTFRPSFLALAAS